MMKPIVARIKARRYAILQAAIGVGWLVITLLLVHGIYMIGEHGQNAVLADRERALRSQVRFLVDQAEEGLLRLAMQPNILDPRADSTRMAMEYQFHLLKKVGITKLSLIHYVEADGQARALLTSSVPDLPIEREDITDQDHIREMLKTGEIVSSKIFDPVESNIHDAVVLNRPVPVDGVKRGAVSYLINLPEFVAYLSKQDPTLDGRLILFVDNEPYPAPVAGKPTFRGSEFRVVDHDWRFDLAYRPARPNGWLLGGLVLLTSTIAAVLWRNLYHRRKMRRVREEQSRKDREHRETLELMRAVVIKHDMHGTIRYANPFAHQLFKYEPGTLEGRNGFDLLIPVKDRQGKPLRERVQREILRLGTQETGAGVLSEHKHLNSRSDGTTVMMSWSRRLIQRADGAVEFLSVGNDVSIQADAEDLKRTLINGQTHELRSPLNGIKSSVFRLRSGHGGPPTPDMLKFLDRIELNRRNLDDLVDNLLSKAQLDASKITPSPARFPIARSIDAILENLKPIIEEKELIVVREIAADPGEIWGDRYMCENIINNLLTNACKFTRSKLKIKVWAGPVGGRYRIAIEDQGRGVSPEDYEKIFEEFEQVDGSRDRAYGFGLGLSVARRFARLHGSDIRIRSQVNRGSIFYFDLPPDPDDGDPVPSSGSGHARGGVQAADARPSANGFGPQLNHASPRDREPNRAEGRPATSHGHQPRAGQPKAARRMAQGGLDGPGK